MRSVAKLVVSLKNLKDNINLVKKSSPGKDFIFMVKSNGYGHGEVPLVDYCVREKLIRHFGVATILEAVNLRDSLPDLEFEIYVFSELAIEKHFSDYQNKRITPIISGIEDLETFLSLPDFSKVPLCIKLNTGMNRLGFEKNQLAKLAELLKLNGRKKIDLLLQHYSSSAIPLVHNQFMQDQINSFSEMKEQIESTGIQVLKRSQSNSGAIEQNLHLNDDVLRPGLIFYGPASSNENLNKWNGKIISRLIVGILKTRKVKKGDNIGYGPSISPADGTVLTVDVGYGDGFSNRFQGVHFKINGKYDAQVIGNINMDMTFLLLKESPDEIFNRGDSITLWNDNLDDFMRICVESKMIPYEIFCQLSIRLPRVYEL